MTNATQAIGASHDALQSIRPEQALTAALLTDFPSLCAPHVAAVRDVLDGKTYRYKLKYQDTTFVFHHGCLMAQVVHDGIIRALPPFGLNEDGTPYLTALPEHQRHWLDEFLGLPKSALLFYFSLLKEVFKGNTLRCRWEDPVNGQVQWVPMAEELRPILAEIGWQIG